MQPSPGDRRHLEPDRGLEAISPDSRDEVDSLVERALATGGRATKPAADEGFMYSRGFHDPGGHLWEFVWMDPSAISG